MTRTQFYTATSINGYIADESNSLEWLFQFGSVASVEDDYRSFIEQVSAIAMGSTTYEWIVAHEKLMDNPGRWPYSVPTWVFSSRDLPAISGANIRFVKGDVAPVHVEMMSAAAGRNIWIVGGGDLVGQFVDHGLLDEIIVTLAPVMLRAGAPLLPRRLVDPPLRLTSVEQHGDVYAVLKYQVRKHPPSMSAD